MAGIKEVGTQSGTLSAAAVSDYLLANPDFFQAHKTLLTKLSIPHAAGGAVSLVERQVEILRQENRRLERRLVEWMEIAQDNDRLLGHLHVLAVALLAAHSHEARLQVLLDRLCDDFTAAAATLIVHEKKAAKSLPAGCRYLARDDDSLKDLDASLKADRPFCRALSQTLNQQLFAKTAEAPGSAAFVPIIVAGTPGLLILGSADPKHFHPALDTTYLTRLGELANAALAQAESDT
ncbi:MAG: DUF484 family protein [Gammaproteobacteria bacterium]|nr:DUF484 family protein [Gammaproteobacteria bacterium]